MRRSGIYRRAAGVVAVAVGVCVCVAVGVRLSVGDGAAVGDGVCVSLGVGVEVGVSPVLSDIRVQSDAIPILYEICLPLVLRPWPPFEVSGWPPRIPVDGNTRPGHLFGCQMGPFSTVKVRNEQPKWVLFRLSSGSLFVDKDSWWSAPPVGEGASRATVVARVVVANGLTTRDWFAWAAWMGVTLNGFNPSQTA